MTELISLLERLTKLQPGLCQHTGYSNIFVLAGRGISADFTYGKPGTYYYDREGVLAWVQYAVQQAIAAREWVFHLTPVHWRVGNFYEVAIVTTGRDGSSESENITEALLSAYLKALEGFLPEEANG